MDLQYFEQANKHYKNGSYDEAIKNYKKSIDLNINETQSLYNIGVCYIKKANGENKKFLNLAIEFLHKAIEKESTNYMGLFNLAHTYDLLHNYKKAYIYINRASLFNIQNDPDCGRLLKKVTRQLINEIQLGEV